MFWDLRVHTPAPLTPDGQHATEEAAEMFAVSLTPAGRGGNEAGSNVASSTVAGPQATVGAVAASLNQSRSCTNVSPSPYDLRRCARCREQNQYCHGHTPIIPNSSLDLPPVPPQFPVRGSVLANSVARFNLNRVQATALASSLINSLENNQDAAEVPPPYQAAGEFTRALSNALGIDEAALAKGLGLQGQRGSGRGQNRNRRSCPVPANKRPANPPAAQVAMRRPIG
jgi:hypothetical protein